MGSVCFYVVTPVDDAVIDYYLTDGVEGCTVAKTIQAALVYDVLCCQCVQIGLNGFVRRCENCVVASRGKYLCNGSLTDFAHWHLMQQLHILAVCIGVFLQIVQYRIFLEDVPVSNIDCFLASHHYQACRNQKDNCSECKTMTHNIR